MKCHASMVYHWYLPCSWMPIMGSMALPYWHTMDTDRYRSIDLIYIQFSAFTTSSMHCTTCHSGDVLVYQASIIAIRTKHW